MLRLSRCLQSALTLSLIVMFALSLPLWSQSQTGAINGTVTDSQGAVIPGATVTAVDVDRHTKFPTTTDNSGLYNIQRLPVGRYEVLVEKSGFVTTKQAAFVLQLNQIAEVNLSLKAGSQKTEITVVDQTPLLETGSEELSTVIDSHATENIPLPTRNYGELTMLSPGAVNPNPGSFTGPQATFQSGRPYLNGNREQTNSYILDGMDNSEHDNNDVAFAPSVDAIQEFNLITQNAPADFGNYLGGVINVTLKSGTDQIHGDAFWFLRNTILNANDWQNNLAGQNASGDEVVPRSQVHWNTFGGTIGGPIIKDKLFFFLDYQGSQFHTGSAGSAQVLNAAERTGNFSDFCPAGFTAGICNASSTTNVQLYLPAAGTAPGARTAVANNTYTTGQLSGAALALVNSTFYPLPTSTTTGNAHSLFYHTATQNNGNQGDVKLDWLPSAKDHVMVRASIMNQDNPTTPSFLLAPSGVTDFQYPLQNIVVDYTRTLTSSLVNDARVGVSHFPINQAFVEPGGNNFPSLFGIGSPSTLMPGFNAGSVSGSQQSFYLQGGFAIGANAGAENKFGDSELQISDALTWTHGKHEVHFGGEFLYYRDIFFYPGNEGVAGELDFGPVYSGNGTAGTGAGEADFLLGLPNGVGIGQNCPTCASGVQTTRHVSNHMLAFYGQDNFRVTSKLTVNLGVRYEDTTPRDFYDHTAINWSLFGGTPLTTSDTAGVKNYTGIADFQPRIGFAWQAAKDTVVRGAFGISNFNETNGVNNLPSQNSPYTIAHNIVYPSNGDYPGSTLAQGFSTLGGGACTLAGVQALTPGCYAGVTQHVTDPNLRPEVSRQWNLSIQHQFGNATTLQIGYTGQSSYHLANIINIAQQVIDQGNAAGNTPSPFLNTFEITSGGQKRFTLSNGISNYNAMQVVLAQRLAHGLQATLNLTWSKCLGDTPGFFGNYGDAYGLSQTFGGWAFPQDSYNQRGDYGLCNYDTRVDFNGYVIYELPFGRGRQFANNMNKIVDGFVGGWQISSDFTFHTGMPWDLLGCGTACGFSFAPRPNCLPGVPQHLTFQMAPASVTQAIGNAFQFLNPASVTNLGTANTDGNCPVDSHEGVGLKTMDLGISKHFHITERQNIELRVEANNFTNTPIFALPPGGGYWGTTLNAGSAGFGTVANSEGARQLQLALKYHF